jgi:4-oxalomesaconate hydratase
MVDAGKTALVVSAHAADFVWRAGGAIALHAARGWSVKIVCLSYGERGESAKLWREPGMTLEKVKANRRAESQAAAEVLGGEVEFFDCGDYPMRVPDEALFRLADLYRSAQPEFVLTHSIEDPYQRLFPQVTDVLS